MSQISDKTALNQIADLLAVEEWQPEYLDYIAGIVEQTGRTTQPTETEQDTDQ